MADQYHHGNLKSKLLEEAVLEAQGHFQTENITLQMNLVEIYMNTLAEKKLWI